MKKYRVLLEIGHWKPLLTGKIPESPDEMLKGVQSSKVKQLGDNGDMCRDVVRTCLSSDFRISDPD